MSIQSDPDFAEFRARCRKREIVVQACLSCRALQWPPRPICSSCRSFDIGWHQVPTPGRVYSWTVVERAGSSRFTVPYAVVLGELQAHTEIRLLANLTGGAEATRRLAIGAPLDIEFQESMDGIVLPQWTLVTD